MPDGLRWVTVLGALMALLMAPTLAVGADEAQRQDAGWTSTIRPLLQRYCWQCHNATRQKGDLDLAGRQGQGDVAAIAHSLQQRLERAEMPPASAPQPTAAERATLVAWLQRQQSGGPSIAGDPGTVVMPHLTPTQYEHVIRDLTGVSMSLAGQLPQDGGAGEGFDNVGAGQIMTASHLQAYFQLAQAVLGHARIMPGMAIDWSRFDRGQELTTSQLHSAILEDWVAWFIAQVDREKWRHLKALAPVLPSDELWTRTVNYYRLVAFGTLNYLVPYLNAAWQYQYRAQLGHPDWTMADVAANYAPVPLHPEVLGTLITDLDPVVVAKSGVPNWIRMVDQWRALPPPPATDAEIRDRILHILGYLFDHSIMRGGDNLQDPEILPPFEINPTVWLTRIGEPRTVMYEQGRRPFRFKLKGMTDLYLVTTDANDGNDEDVMIWEHGVLERNGHDEPWTVLKITDLSGAVVPWGSHPMGAAAGLPKESIAVHAPAVLHLVFPPGTTGLRVDARADPVYAKNGSMQAATFDRPPTPDELHLVPFRYIFGAPHSRRQRAIEGENCLGPRLGNPSILFNYRTFPALLPPEVIRRWKIAPDPFELTVDPKDPRSFKTPLGDIAYMWNESSRAIRSYAQPADRAALDLLAEQLRGTIEQRDLLADFLRHAQGFKDENPAAALSFVPPPMDAGSTALYQDLKARAIADETRMAASASVQINDFGQRAWRQAVPARALNAMLDIYRSGRDQGLCYEAAMKMALQPILISPHFLYRIQEAHLQAAPYALSPRDLCERLAFTLWGSLPDEQLLRAAATGQLSDPQQRRQQCLRMLADPRAISLACDFAAQAYLFAGFDHATGPDAMRFPTFSDMRGPLYQECVQFFSYVFQHDRPLTDLIDADYMFVNDALAAFYGLPNVAGGNFRKVSVDQHLRGGVLGLGAILVTTSTPLRTSPIKRGNWVLSQLLGTPPPPPPPVVPQFSHDEHDASGLGILQQMRQHRSDARCISCHARIDPLGVALENFDPIGRTRQAAAHAGSLADLATTVDGCRLESFDGLKRYLMSEPRLTTCMRNLCRKFMGYALGRALIPADEATLDGIMADLKANGWRASVLITDVVESPEFRQRSDSTADADTTPAQETKP